MFCAHSINSEPPFHPACKSTALGRSTTAGMEMWTQKIKQGNETYEQRYGRKGATARRSI
jgi:hypothetical protein